MRASTSEKRLVDLMDRWEDAIATEEYMAERGEPCPGAERAKAHVRTELQKLMPSLTPTQRYDAHSYFREILGMPPGLPGMVEA
jgi:hypothetical protein